MAGGYDFEPMGCKVYSHGQYEWKWKNGTGFTDHMFNLQENLKFGDNNVGASVWFSNKKEGVFPYCKALSLQFAHFSENAKFWGLLRAHSGDVVLGTQVALGRFGKIASELGATWKKGADMEKRGDHVVHGIMKDVPLHLRFVYENKLAKGVTYNSLHCLGGEWKSRDTIALQVTPVAKVVLGY